MAGLLGDFSVADIYSAADTVKKRVKGLLDPAFWGGLNEDAKSRLDQMKALAYQTGGAFPQMAKNDPAFNAQQAAAAQQRLQDIAMQGITVWHGSPHKFDKFDSAHIGKGEGAQAYGHGLYFAENPKVAMEYQNLKPIVDPTDTGFIQARAAWAESKGNAKKALAYLDKQEKIVNNARDFLIDKGASSLADIAKARELITSGQMTPGNLYKVDLPDSAVERMLDWDAKLNEQPEAVRKALLKAGIAKEEMPLVAVEPRGDRFQLVVDNVVSGVFDTKQAAEEAASAVGKRWYPSDRVKPSYGGNPEVGTLYNNLAASMPGWDQKAAASAALRKAGIPGIRYLDGGSRGAGTGTRNFVVFPGEEGLLSILERNGRGLLGQ